MTAIVLGVLTFVGVMIQTFFPAGESRARRALKAEADLLNALPVELKPGLQRQLSVRLAEYLDSQQPAPPNSLRRVLVPGAFVAAIGLVGLALVEPWTGLRRMAPHFFEVYAPQIGRGVLAVGYVLLLTILAPATFRLYRAMRDRMAGRRRSADDERPPGP